MQTIGKHRKIYLIAFGAIRKMIVMIYSFFMEYLLKRKLPMAFLVSDCPRCGTRKINFLVIGAHLSEVVRDSFHGNRDAG